MVQERKRAKFSELSDEKKQRVSKMCFDAALACGFRGSLIKQKYQFASSQFILDKANYYYENYANNEEKKAYDKVKGEYDTLANSKGIYYREDTKYQQYINDINSINDMPTLDAYIKGNNPSGKEIPIHQLNVAVADRLRALNDKDGLYSAVKEKLLQYGKYKYEMRAKKNQDKSKLTLEENKILSKLTLQDFLSSEFIYKQEYCKDRKLSVNTFDKRVANVKEFDSEFYQGYLESLDNKKQTYYDSLKPVVEDILTNIKDNKDYNIIDYFISYKDLYKFEDLCNSCNKYHMDIRSLKTFLSKVDVRSSLNYDAFMNQYYKAFDHEFSDEEKDEIYNYAKEHCIPFNWHNVSLLVKRDPRFNTEINKR